MDSKVMPNQAPAHSQHNDNLQTAPPSYHPSSSSQPNNMGGSQNINSSYMCVMRRIIQSCIIANHTTHTLI